MGCRHASYRFYMFVRQDNLKAGWSRDRIVTTLQQAGVPACRGHVPKSIASAPLMAMTVEPASPLPVASRLGEDSIALLVHPTIDDATMTEIAKETAGILSKAATAQS